MKQKIIFLTKGLGDFIVALLLVLILLPIFIATAVLIVLDSGFPVFFTQARIGKQGKAFKIYKFRTMGVEDPKSTTGNILLMDDHRITKVGKYLRKYSLDELPQLINVLRGEMSIIGPRPTLEYQVKKYTNRQFGRLAVKPGITGWAQVNGRNSLSWARKIELDLWYIENISLLLDIKILFLTLLVILKSTGIYAKDKNDEIAKSG